MSNPHIYYGNNPQQFAPCDAVLVQRVDSIKTHPAVLAISNKSERRRLVKSYAKRGIKTFVRPVWEIYPPNTRP